MIYLMEMQCASWEHEKVNAGFVKQVREACPSEKIVLWASKAHIECIDSVYNLEINDIDARVVTVYDKSRDLEDDEVVTVYKDIIYSCLEQSKVRPRSIILLSSNRQIIQACLKVVNEFDISIYIVFHSRLERELLGPAAVNENANSLVHVINSISDERIHFICYSPFIKKNAGAILARHALEHFIFLHHPIVPNLATGEAPFNSGKLVLGLFGAGLKKKNMFDNYMYDTNGSSKYVIKTLEGETANTSLEVDDFIKQSSYILIPYDCLSYRLAASGIFWDAMRNGTPVVTLDSEYFKYYEHFNTAIIKSSTEEIFRNIKELIVKRDACAKEIPYLLEYVYSQNKAVLIDMLN